MDLGLTRSVTKLSDGRELIYYDETPGHDRSAADQRDLPTVSTTSQLRRDVLTGEVTTVAGHRQDRIFLPAADQCPLDPSRPGHPTEIPAADYDVAVFENRFPSLAGDTGRCEVVVFSSDHGSSFGSLPVSRIRSIVDVWADRTAELAQRPGVEYVYCFENRGVEVGVTLHHPHGQIYAYTYVPPRMQKMLEVATAYHESTGGCVACDALAEEKAEGTRVIVAGEHFTAYVPYAGRWPFQVDIVPHRHVPDLPALTAAERDELAAIGKDCVQRLDALFDGAMPYIGSWYQAPVATGRVESHLRWQFAAFRRAPGKLKYLAGSESGAGAFMNDIRPEQAAALLRGEGPAS
ncbi:MAG: galactose-1-phosphate uridylyltransferase [Catenulisporales bacterium]|nr:galactose-1-phosphate uridylyltransferase [Catenulisporales bacterium]